MRRASSAAIISFTKFSAVRHTTVPSGRAWARPAATAESRWVLPSPQPPQRKSGLKRAPGCATTARAAPSAPRLDPYGVQHPRPHFEPDPRRASEDPPRNAPQAGEKLPNSPTRALTRLRPPPETPHRPTAASSCARRPRPTTLHLIASFE